MCEAGGKVSSKIFTLLRFSVPTHYQGVLKLALHLQSNNGTFVACNASVM